MVHKLMKLIIKNLGTISYESAYSYQETCLNEVQGGASDHLLLMEHPKVITLGLHANPENILLSESELERRGYQVISTRRGGDVTYHGPGQLVGYTIFNLKKNHGGSIKTFVNQLEQLFIDLLKTHFDIHATRDPINSGVFVGNSKILAIGLAVRRGVTMHGFALNVNTNLEDFKAIVPCGLKERDVTSIHRLTSRYQDIEAIKLVVANAFISQFGFDPL